MVSISLQKVMKVPCFCGLPLVKASCQHDRLAGNNVLGSELSDTNIARNPGEDVIDSVYEISHIDAGVMSWTAQIQTFVCIPDS